MKRRIFIAINLSEDIKNKLIARQKEWADLPVRFTKKNSLHLTIVFIGYVTDDEMFDICRKVKIIAREHRSFRINFSRICFGPPGKPPRLIWLEGEKNEALFRLKHELEAAVFQGGVGSGDFVERGGGEKKLLLHITLARIRQMEWRNLPQKPIINQQFSVEVAVDNIEVMESNLRRDGAEYAVLESAELGRGFKN